MSTRHAFSLVEILLVLVIMALVSLVMLRQVHSMLDRIEARNAVRDAGALVARARDEAMAQQTPVTFRVDTLAGSVYLASRYGPIARAPLAAAHGVTVSTSRDSITFDVRGLGYGAANLTLVVRRGGAAESLVTSRLGRLRY